MKLFMFFEYWVDWCCKVESLFSVVMGDVRFWCEFCCWWLVYFIVIGGYYFVVSGGCVVRSVVIDLKDYIVKYCFILSTG